MWLVVLSDQLPIVALVSHYPTNKLIGRRPLQRRLAALSLSSHAVLAPVSQRYPPPLDMFLRVTHPSATDTRKCPCDLHVLSMPPAFALSQDQTLKFISMMPSENSKHTSEKTQTRTQPTHFFYPYPSPTNDQSKTRSTGHASSPTINKRKSTKLFLVFRKTDFHVKDQITRRRRSVTGQPFQAA